MLRDRWRRMLCASPSLPPVAAYCRTCRCPAKPETKTEGLWHAWAPRYMHSRSAPLCSTMRLGRPAKKKKPKTL